MKQVTLTRPMRGVGDKPVLPDEIADKMVADGEATDARPWPATPAAAVAGSPRRARPHISRKVR